MKLSLIVAIAKNGVIGNDASLPWDLPEDLRFFRKKTWGKAVILGYNTFAMLPVVLDNRRCVVVTRKDTINGKGDFVRAVSPEHALRLAEEHAQANQYDEVFVAGGSQVYGLFFSLVTTMYITEIDLLPEGDTFFPRFDTTLWHCTESALSTSKNGINYCRKTYTRKG